MNRLLIAALLFSTACVQTTVRPVPTPAPAPVAPAAAEKPVHLLYATLWYQTSVEARALSQQTFTAASDQLDRLLADTSITAAVEQTGDFASLPPAVIADIDETMLDNSPFEARLIRNGGSFTPEGWTSWVEERAATAVPGAVEFARAAAAKGITVFYVSNREAHHELATRTNLVRLGFPVEVNFDTVLLRGERDEWSQSEKASRRAHVAATHRILMLLGDDLGDFLPGIRVSKGERDRIVAPYEAWWGRRWFVLPNPMYGSWEGALTSGAPPEERRQRLLDALRTEQ